MKILIEIPEDLKCGEIHRGNGNALYYLCCFCGGRKFEFSSNYKAHIIVLPSMEIFVQSE